ncbi:MAG: hypothetical protein Tsb0010_07070 [Parvularculaceae bacterium]
MKRALTATLLCFWAALGAAMGQETDPAEAIARALLPENFETLAPDEQIEALDQRMKGLPANAPASVIAWLAMEILEAALADANYARGSERAKALFAQIDPESLSEEDYVSFAELAAIAHTRVSAFDEAFAVLEALREYQRTHESELAKQTADFITSDIYLQIGEFDRAADVLERMLEDLPEEQTADSLDSHGILINNLAFALTGAGRPERALEKLEEARRINRAYAASPGADAGLAHATDIFITSNVGEALLLQGDYDALAPLAAQVAQGGRSIGNKYLEAIGRRLLAEAAMGRGQQADALAHFNAAQAIAEEIGEEELLSKIYLGHAAALERVGRYEEALAAFRKYDALREKANEVRVRGRLAMIASDAARQMRDQELELLRAEQEFTQSISRRDRGIAVLSVAAVLFLASSLAALGYAYIQQHRAKIELAKREREAQAASRAKSEFLANMSHEIRTPMNGVLGMAQLLRQTDLTQKQAMYAETIYNSGAALLTIINDILDFSKIEAGKLELDPAPFNLAEAVEDVAILLGPTAREKGLELITRCDPGAPEQVVGDAGRFRQVLTNLIGNALKFTHEGYVLVEMRTEIEDGLAQLRLEVADTGIGIPEDKIDRIFDQFTQAEATTTKRFGGTGLGLSISKGIIEAMGGRIGVDSKLGEGSVFWAEFTLPVSDAAPNAPAAPVKLDNIPILIVDDLEVNRRILLEQFANWGAAPIAAESGERALQRLREAAEAEAPVPLVVTDFHMPEMDGLALLQRIRSDDLIKDAKVIVLASVDDKETASAFKALGVAAYLQKPARSAELRMALYAAIANHNLAAMKELARGGPLIADSGAAVAPPRVLVAEDNHVNRVVLENMLEGVDCDLIFAADGKEAYELFKGERPQLILMDVSMPVMDGVEATKAIRSHEHRAGWTQTPIIALTAHTLEGARDAYLECGMNDYLAKPLDKSAVQAMLAKWLPGSDKTRPGGAEVRQA